MPFIFFYLYQATPQLISSFTLRIFFLLQPKNLRRTTAKSASVVLEDLLSESEESEDDSSDKNWVPVENGKPSKKVPTGVSCLDGLGDGQCGSYFSAL